MSGDGRFLFVREGQVPARIARIKLAAGLQSPWKDLSPPDPAGVGHIRAIALAPDGQGDA